MAFRFDGFQLPTMEPTYQLGDGPPGNVFERRALDATVPIAPSSPREADYRVLSPDEVMPDTSGRWDQLVRAAQSGGRTLRPKQQATLDAMPKVLSREGMTRKQRHAVDDERAIAEGRPTRRELTMQGISNMFSGWAAGAAATTGMPAWERANAQLMRDRSFYGDQAGARDKSRLSALASLGKSQADEMEQRQKLLTDPMVEFEGQVMPREAVENILQRRAVEGRFRETDERLREFEQGRDEDRDRAVTARVDAAAAAQAVREAVLANTQDYRERVLALRQQGLSNLEAHREAMRGLSERSVAVREKSAGGAGKPLTPPSHADVRKAKEQAMVEAGLSPAYDAETPAVRARAAQILAEQQAMRDLDDPFADIMSGLGDDTIEDEF